MENKIIEFRALQRDNLCRIRKEGHANVVFIISSLSMWQHQDIFDMMSANRHFSVYVIYVPFNTFSAEEADAGWHQCSDYFKERNIPLIKYSELDFSEKSFREQFKPDIIFYPQWYSTVYDDNVDIHSFYDCLICLIPYGMSWISVKANSNAEGNYLAWRQYLITDADQKEFIESSPNKGDNSCVVGYPKASLYSVPTSSDPWKCQERKKKRIIWAPHFTIPSANSFLHQSSFLTLADVMLRMADEYKESVQFAFKPHPRLKTELYKHPEWGKEKTDAYYEKWHSKDNTQLETGEYIDLFKCSDAMIHDSGSFLSEYLYVHKPVFFTTDDPERLKISEQMSELGIQSMKASYKGLTEQEIRQFVEDVVLKGNDTLRDVREKVYECFLRLPGNKTPSELIYEDICRALHFYEKESCSKLLTVPVWLRLLFFVLLTIIVIIFILL